MKKEIFIKKSRINASAEDVFQWHARPGALERLAPPYDPIWVVDRRGGIRKGATATLKIKAGPLHLKWIAEHTDYEENRLFRDCQKKGPFAFWRHSHRFEPDTDESCFMEDQIEYALLFNPLNRPFIPVIRQKLERIFHYRHATLAHDLSLHNLRRAKKPLHIVIAGASGLIGSALIPFLTTGGHQVTRLVRKTPLPGANEVFWDPLDGRLEPSELKNPDVVINLCGEHIGQGRWTTAKKRTIIESRTQSTALLVKTIAQLKQPPKVLINASAIGYYGDRGEQSLTEEDSSGDAFISDVCRQWENEAAPAAANGIRVVLLRIGIVLSPLGAALARMLLPFKSGVGGKFGSGGQFMSPIGIDDVIGAIFHAINEDRLQGPVNVVAPDSVTNLEFVQTLGRVLKRPTFFSMPETAIKIMFGEMGRELLLASARVYPQKLLETGYKFRNPDLESILRHLLGLEK
ncbi:TIGR01777 family oxidoreductase [Desulfococcaceae bacterium HSG9]|nr:TIGR01777 family oxidoreductase [Desulfococcaceae bacterium HSG9]